MPNLVRIPVDGVDDLLNAGLFDAGAVVRLHSATTKTGTYASVGTASLVSGTNSYTIYHAAGTSSTWYKTRFENAGATIVSDWSDPFQVGGEAGGYLCSLYDVRQALGLPGDTASSQDEALLELIRSVSAEIERATEQDFTGDRDDQVYTFDVDAATQTLWVPRGVQSITTLEVADSTGGAYATITDHYLRPANRAWLGQPASRVELDSSYFYAGLDTVRLTGKLGWAEVPPEVARIAADVVANRHVTKGSAGPRVVIGPDGRTTILRDFSPADWETLMGFRALVAA